MFKVSTHHTAPSQPVWMIQNTAHFLCSVDVFSFTLIKKEMDKVSRFVFAGHRRSQARSGGGCSVLKSFSQSLRRHKWLGSSCRLWGGCLRLETHKTSLFIFIIIYLFYLSCTRQYVWLQMQNYSFIHHSCDLILIWK